MTVKRKKPPISARTAVRLMRQVELLGEQKHKYIEQFKRYKADCHGIMTGYVSQIRTATNRIATLNDTLANNNVTITELQGQVAVQLRLVAEAQDDGARAISLHNHNLTVLISLRDKLIRTEADLADARETLGYRIRVRFEQWLARTSDAIKRAFTKRKSRIVNWWLVRRLNKARVGAMGEAGYIPEKLVHLAHKYWEADQERMGQTIETLDSYGQSTIRAQTPWRRLKIFLGRA